MRNTIIILLSGFLGVCNGQTNPDHIPLIPSIEGSDIVYSFGRGRMYKIPIDSILAYVEVNISSSGVTDGDKGDITVSSSGAVWDIDANTISAVELSNNSVGANEIAMSGVTAGSYTNTNLTVDGDGRITLASNGSTGGGANPGTGTTNRVAYWNSSTSLGDFPIELNTSNVRFTQSTGVRLPRGSTGFAPSASQGFIRFDTTIDEFTGCRDGATYEPLSMQGDEAMQQFLITSSSTITPNKSLFVIHQTGAATATATIDDTNMITGQILCVYVRGRTLTLATSGSETFLLNTGTISSTHTITSNGSAMFVYAGNWYQIH